MVEFSYNASAAAAGGVIQLTNGRTVVVPSLASVALSPSGGEGTTVVRNYYSEELSFSYAESRVLGTKFGENGFVTRTDICITNLRVLNALSIASLEATVRSTRIVNDPADPNDDDHEFELDASYYGVEALEKMGRGCAIAPAVNVSLKNVKRYGDISNLLAANAKIADLFDATKDELAEALGKKAPVLGSLVEEVRHEPTSSVHRAPGKPHKLVIPGVGVVRFGEVMLKPGRRRVNLVRIKLGADGRRELTGGIVPEGVTENLESTSSVYSGGSMTFGSVEGNGSPLWP